MKTLHLSIIATAAIFYGFFHMAFAFWFFPHGNFPFPFQHVFNIRLHDNGAEYEISGDLNYAIASDPYWLIWSFSLYSGIVLLSILAVKKLKQRKQF